jgi:hypothetical protein
MAAPLAKSTMMLKVKVACTILSAIIITVFIHFHTHFPKQNAFKYAGLRGISTTRPASAQVWTVIAGCLNAKYS